MIKRIGVIVFLAIFVSLSAAYCQEPNYVDTVGTVKEGVALYEKGDFKGAIAKYNLVLSVDPKNDDALYERAMAYLAAGDYSKCMDDAETGLKKKSKLEAAYYALAGNCMSAQKRNKEAMKYYKTGLKKFPDDEQLQFNIAITLYDLGKTQEAREHLKKVLEVNPNRASANLYLAILYQKDSYRPQAMFMFLRFLLVEPSSARSKRAIGEVLALVNQGVNKKDKSTITLNINPDAIGKKDEGGEAFGALNLAMSISAAAAGADDDKKNQSEADMSVDTIESIVQIADEMKDRKMKKSFVWKQAISVLVKMKEADVLKPFLYEELGLLKMEGCEKWLENNPEKLTKLNQWMTENMKTK